MTTNTRTKTMQANATTGIDEFLPNQLSAAGGKRLPGIIVRASDK